ncbi:hypothetical protein [Serratia odorifera]|jgi:hypothetical protein|uniref:Uncharacterized protein n=2 Tax=Serratia odorifera TaxID=618 RepID=D4E653_SEROD|nr:hypothetical protein [Serratia odorifera]EFE94782.1 hypothetical protein HMPREF0758_3653 [Serratia odorifera DSM 4582]MBJ2064815.1 hypothetical protein [Serratia odorifera]PNK89512.1 hypothetical protein CEQ31_007255 [Serratia odorifera]RII70902.1 hypothetical protein DX901_19060 [Serratia odorifera]VDZ63098.1 Uncharacterised protein [Serratia odorifera]
MEKHFVLDIQHAGKAFAQLHLMTPWAASQLQQACALFPAEQGYQVQINQVKERRMLYQSGNQGITLLGESLILQPCVATSKVQP